MTRRIYALMPRSGPPTQYAVYENRHVRILPARDIGSKADDDLIVFVPGTEICLTDLKLPNRPVAELARVALFALEDDLAEPVENLHAAIAAPNANDTRTVMVCSRALLDDWKQTLRGAGIKSARLVPDAYVVPDGAYAIDADDRVLMSIAGRRFAVDAALPDDALHALTAAETGSIKVMGDALEARFQRATTQLPATPLLACLASWADDVETLPDLCQGQFTTKPKSSLKWRTLRPTLAMAALCMVVLVTQKIVEIRSLTQLKTAMETQAGAAWAAANPGQPVPANLNTALASKENVQKNMRISFLQATAHLYEALPPSGDVSIESLRYDGQQGQLTANLVYPSHGGDIDLKRELEAAGIGVRVGDSRQIDGRVLGTLTLGNANE